MAKDLKTVTPDLIMNSVLAKLYDVLCNGEKGELDKTSDHYLAWVTPGIPMSVDAFRWADEGFRGIVKGEVSEDKLKAMKADDLYQKYMKAEDFSRLVDYLPDTSGTGNQCTINVFNVENILSQVYQQVLHNADVPVKQLTDAQKAKLEGWRNKLVQVIEKVDLITDEKSEVKEASELVKTYSRYMKEYLEAVMYYNSKKINAESGDDPAAISDWAYNAKNYRDAVQNAMKQWITLGYKNGYEQLVAAIAQMEDGNYSTLLEEFKDAFANSQMTSVLTKGDFYIAQPVPGGFAHSPGWTEFEFTSSDYEGKYSEQSHSANIKAAGFYNMFTGGGTAGGGFSETKGSISKSGFSMKFKIAQVPIVRPWFNAAFIQSGKWKWAHGAIDKSQLSDGADPPKGSLPAYTTTCIFVKDLKLKFDASESSDCKRALHGSAGGFVGWGPFALGGSYKGKHESRDSKRHTEGQEITVDGMQLIGFKCHKLDKCPDPDLTITEWVQSGKVEAEPVM